MTVSVPHIVDASGVIPRGIDAIDISVLIMTISMIQNLPFHPCLGILTLRTELRTHSK